jgi:hypothetical protein
LPPEVRRLEQRVDDVVRERHCPAQAAKGVLTAFQERLAGAHNPEALPEPAGPQEPAQLERSAGAHNPEALRALTEPEE